MTATKEEQLLAYSVFYLVETDEQDYELELLTDKEVEATDPLPADNLLFNRVRLCPELKEALNELGIEEDLENISHNYYYEYGDETKQFINGYWGLNEKGEVE